MTTVVTRFGYTPDGSMVSFSGQNMAELADAMQGYLVERRADGSAVSVPFRLESDAERVRREARARLAAKRAKRAHARFLDELRFDVGMVEGASWAVDALLEVIDLHADRYHDCEDYEGSVCDTLSVIARNFHVQLPA